MQGNLSHLTEEARIMERMRANHYQRAFNAPRSFYKPLVPNEGMEQLLDQLLETQGRAMGDMNRKVDDLYINLDARLNSLKRDIGRLYARVDELEARDEFRWNRRNRESVRVIQALRIKETTTEEESSGENSPCISEQGVGRLPQTVDRLPLSTPVDRLPSGVDRLSLRSDQTDSDSSRITVKARSFIPVKDEEEEEPLVCPKMQRPPEKKRKDKTDAQTFLQWISIDEHYDDFDPEDFNMTDADIDSYSEFEAEDMMYSMPFVEKLCLEGDLKRIVRWLLEDRISISGATSRFAAMCDREIAYRMPEKMGDPGKFELTVHIGPHRFEHCLCDLGASISILPHSAFKTLGLTNITPCEDVIRLADNSELSPIGKLKNIPVMVGDRFIPVDFYILEMEFDDCEDLGLILGRPFLKTAGAIIDMIEETITLKNVGTPAPIFEITRKKSKSEKGKRVHKIAAITRLKKKRVEDDDPDFIVGRLPQTVDRLPTRRPTVSSRPITPASPRVTRRCNSRPTNPTVDRLPRLIADNSRTIPTIGTGSNRIQSMINWVKPENIEYRIPTAVSTVRSEFEAEVDNLHKEVLEMWPFIRQCGLEISVRKHVSDLLDGCTTTSMFCALIAKLCDGAILDSIPRKSEDPGPPTVNCMIGYTWFENILCDTGASANIMPLSVARRLGFSWLTNRKMYLKLADDSQKETEGVLENVPVRVNGRFYPVDFQVLKYTEEPSHLLILGRPFLSTANASIDCKTGEVILGDQATYFGKRPPGFEHAEPCGMFKIPQKTPSHASARKPRMSVHRLYKKDFFKTVDLSDDEQMDEQDAMSSSAHQSG